MIPQSTYLFAGIVAVLASAGAMSSRLDGQTRMILAVAAMAWWGVFSLNSLSVAVPDGAGAFKSFRLFSFTILGAVNAVIMLLVAIDKTRDQSPTPDGRGVME